MNQETSAVQDDLEFRQILSRTISANLEAKRLNMMGEKISLSEDDISAMTVSELVSSRVSVLYSSFPELLAPYAKTNSSLSIVIDFPGLIIGEPVHHADAIRVEQDEKVVSRNHDLHPIAEI